MTAEVWILDFDADGSNHKLTGNGPPLFRGEGLRGESMTGGITIYGTVLRNDGIASVVAWTTDKKKARALQERLGRRVTGSGNGPKAA